MAYPASLIAYAFVQKGIAEGIFVTQMKLQKLVYFAHGYHLAIYGEPLLKDNIQAWQFGPVVPKIYQEYKLYGSRPITDTDLLMTGDSKQYSLAQLNRDAISTIDYTWEALKHVSAAQLSNWTHKEESPWFKYYSPGSFDVVIPDEDIQDYFKGFLTAA